MSASSGLNARQVLRVRVGEIIARRMGRFTIFQKVAFAALLAVIFLIFVGAIVRTTGSGMGCPDWPKCWGQYIPPTDKSQIKVDELPLEKYSKRYERYKGGQKLDPDKVVDEFNVVHTWVEFINRLCSLPVGLFTLLTMILAFRFRAGRPLVFYASFAAIVLVGVNAWMGMQIVYSGLKPGTITTHMALAILLMCIQVYIVWDGGQKRFVIPFKEGSEKTLKWIGLALFVFIIIEGVMGSQVREMTDTLQKFHKDQPRSEWVNELEETWMYLVHRSFSWVILATAVLFYAHASSNRIGGVKWQEKVVLLMVLSQMVLGIILSQLGVLPVVQVLHIGLSSILVCALFTWLLGAFGKPRESDECGGEVESETPQSA